MIERNKSGNGFMGNLVFGVAQLVDGLVRVLSLGALYTRLPLEVSKYQAKRRGLALRRMQK